MPHKLYCWRVSAWPGVCGLGTQGLYKVGYTSNTEKGPSGYIEQASRVETLCFRYSMFTILIECS